MTKLEETVEILRKKIAVLEVEVASVKKLEWIVLTAVLTQLVVNYMR